mmetsp:Transcript_6131/g.9578  ORF Transcript_6131/g.9578 Transcript_6131/m.9578 type:complete len:179 (-) Transcript_6131:142-678(-)|eukprot:CAMPEP_0203774430 /NCGR_PEP_ID=MMETSP0099_2-20121227/5330_1 /ASSEMBLY_ACC=CAM_ASM_000209 /TAXON_ID=96639 /ORGANISM=" , Strain NY0313808BC1" /LENGTH=178 /DNA_ID=CAMNT_0050672613 /DNA_START=350 /DNA_END=886 /DNA_ORIENTATION=-
MAGKRHFSEIGQPTGQQSGQEVVAGDSVLGGIKKLRINSPLYGAGPYVPSEDTEELRQINEYSSFNNLLRTLHHERIARSRGTPRQKVTFEGGSGTLLDGRTGFSNSNNARYQPRMVEEGDIDKPFVVSEGRLRFQAGVLHSQEQNQRTNYQSNPSTVHTNTSIQDNEDDVDMDDEFL